MPGLPDPRIVIRETYCRRRSGRRKRPDTGTHPVDRQRYCLDIPRFPNTAILAAVVGLGDKNIRIKNHTEITTTASVVDRYRDLIRSLIGSSALISQLAQCSRGLCHGGVQTLSGIMTLSGINRFYAT